MDSGRTAWTSGGTGSSSASETPGRGGGGGGADEDGVAEKRRNWDGAALEKPYPLLPMVLADVDAIRCAPAMFALFVTVKMLEDARWKYQTRRHLQCTFLV